jgi:hypothetical protein
MRFVRVRDRREHLEHQPHACRDAERMGVAVAVDVFTAYVFEHEIRGTRRRESGIDQA